MGEGRKPSSQGESEGQLGAQRGLRQPGPTLVPIRVCIYPCPQ